MIKILNKTAQAWLKYREKHEQDMKDKGRGRLMNYTPTDRLRDTLKAAGELSEPFPEDVREAFDKWLAQQEAKPDSSKEAQDLFSIATGVFAEDAKA